VDVNRKKNFRALLLKMGPRTACIVAMHRESATQSGAPRRRGPKAKISRVKWVDSTHGVILKAKA
ncbi:hypothetical protein HAX54_038151, partial [Datura stramonium]|nr:hypothetical protein [Datura stramonium]